MIKLERYITIYIDNVKNFNLNQRQVVYKHCNKHWLNKKGKFIKN